MERRVQAFTLVGSREVVLTAKAVGCTRIARPGTTRCRCSAQLSGCATCRCPWCFAARTIDSSGARRQIVARYNEAFRGQDYLTTPYERDGLDSTFHLYVLQVDFRQLRIDRRTVMEEAESGWNRYSGALHPRAPPAILPGNLRLPTRDFPLPRPSTKERLSIPLYHG